MIKNLEEDLNKLKKIEYLLNLTRKLNEVVISLLMFLGDPPILKEHLLMKNVAQCLEKKSNRIQTMRIQMMKVKAMKDEDN